jgi:ABC-type glycerol-3-phosphate transport system permease component
MAEAVATLPDQACAKLPWELGAAVRIDGARQMQLFRRVAQGTSALPPAALHHAFMRCMVPGLSAGAVKR